VKRNGPQGASSDPRMMGLALPQMSLSAL